MYMMKSNNVMCRESWRFAHRMYSTGCRQMLLRLTATRVGIFSILPIGMVVHAGGQMITRKSKMVQKKGGRKKNILLVHNLNKKTM